MMRTLIRALGGMAMAMLVASPASAQTVQSVQFGFGGFFPRGLDSRADGDVLLDNLTRPALPRPDDDITDSLAFEIEDFRNVHVFGEWLVAFGDHVEFGAGVGYYSRSVPSVYVDLIDIDGSELEQELKLRIVPVTGVVRFLPFGRMGEFQPYIGGGIGVLNWRYSETGEFVDTFDFSIFDARSTATGTAVGPVFLGGIRIPIQGDIYGLTLEYAYQSGVGDTGGSANGFLADKIDLGGGKFNVAFLVRF